MRNESKQMGKNNNNPVIKNDAIKFKIKVKNFDESYINSTIGMYILKLYNFQ